MITTYQGRSGPSLAQQLYQLYQLGSFTYGKYQELKKAHPGKQKKAISNATGLRGGNKGSTTTTVNVTVPKLKRQVKNIQRQLHHDLAQHLRRKITSGVLFTNANEQIYALQWTGCEGSAIQAAMDTLRYYDPANPATLVTADASSGTYSRDISIKNVNYTCEYRNNYQTPLVISIYECISREDTNIAPGDAMNQSITDQFLTGGNNTQWGVYPSDCKQLNEYYRVKRAFRKVLQAGQSVTYKRNSGAFTFNPAIYDQHNLNYQKQWKSAPILVNVVGVPAHDTANLEYGFCQTGIDWVATTTTKIEYDAGASLDDISVVNQLDAFTNGARVSNKPVADNQPFSVI